MDKYLLTTMLKEDINLKPNFVLSMQFMQDIYLMYSFHNEVAKFLNSDFLVYS